ncbi:MAG TPA: diacylglycerol kinase family protein [Acidobacteriaceae bacterium]|nr:diacylglycerol kinase family protein [Acidobacteriaceae bacterium]HTX42364.1 diacylglycerol kinase family protein [Acidobacteriaceae bacterium]
MRRVLLFLNPLLIHNARRRAAVEQIAELLSSYGSDVHLQETLSAHSAGQQASEAVAAGFDTFLVCGGDGTVFEVMQGVAGSGAALGVLPFGTGNVIAQNLRLPRNPLLAAHMLLHAQARPVSLGKIELSPPGHKRMRSWFFFIAAGMGMHAALMNLAPTGQGKRHGGRLAYFVGGAKLLLEHRVQPFTIEMTYADGSTTTEVACEAIATHVPEINRWHPQGDPFGDALRLAWLPQTGRLGLGHASFHALATRQVNGHYGWGGLPMPRYESVRRLICRPLNGAACDQPLLVEADGEVLGASYAVIGMAAERLNLLWPNGSAPQPADS